MTVLFADLVGFTSMSGDRDAEDVRELLSRYFDTARTVITRYGGTVEKFIGDAVMAVWGAPAIQEDDAERAVRAALELVDAVSAFGEEVGAPGLMARAGVLTGEAAVTVGAIGEGIVAGDLVNTASRMQAAAEPGTVYVGDATRQATEAAIVYEDAGTHQLKGKAEAVRLWRAIRVVAARGGALRPTGLEGPFVGRDRELRLLKDYLHATAEEGKARLLSIVGVGGVGKSRLAWEFFKYVDGLSEVVYWHRGRCLAYGEGVAYWALSEMVRMRAGIVDNEPAASAREKLRSSVLEFVPEEEERRWVEPRLAHLLGLEEGVATEPRDLYAAWRFFIERMAGRKPTVLVFEDLQWADAGLLDFIEYLLEWSRNSPLFIVTLARPEIADRRPGWGAARRGLTSQYLEPLSSEAMGQLLDGLVPGLPADLSARIRERAAGIPLYAVETVRMLLDRGLLVEQGGIYRAQGSLESLEVPESLHALIAARLDSLGAAERQVLQDASVLGKSFTAHALRSITAIAASESDQALSSLVDKDLLSMQSDPRSPERGQYVFVQDLVRGVAYGTLARRERKLRHLAAAGYLESSWSEEEEVAEVVASHLIEAYEADTEAADAAEVRDRARTALVQAGDHALSFAAAASAQGYYERALALGGGEEAQADLHAKAGGTAFLQGQRSTAREHLDEAISLYQALQQTGPAARVVSRLARVDLMEGKNDDGIERMRRALAMLSSTDAQDADHETDIATIAAQLGKQLYFRGDLDQALECAEQALQIAEVASLPEAFVIALDTRACVLCARGRRDEAELLFQGALMVAAVHDVSAERVRILHQNLASTFEESDRLDESLDHYGQAEALSRRLGDRVGEVSGRLTRAWALLELGRWDEYAALYTSYLEADAPDLGSVPWLAGMEIHVASLYLRRGDVAAARALIAEKSSVLEHAHVEMRGAYTAMRAALANADGRSADAWTLAEEGLRACLDQSFPVPAAANLIEAAVAAVALQRDDRVEDLIGLVREHYRPGRQPSIDAHILRWQASLAAHRGNEAEAVAAFSDAIQAFTSLRRPFWTAVTRLEHGEWLAAQGRVAEAEDMLAPAAATFADLGAVPWLERANSARVTHQTQREAPTAMPA